ncbi:hypothetical protein FACS189449_00140 [Alphaproteobacteria bacterium]|nr:hypothetical protein FACS189449_00140 [Alphaproteobacteria bacterium]
MADDFPLISVMIPTYNRTQLLKEAIDSVLAQDYPNIEIIVVDDGSDNVTVSAIQAFTHVDSAATLQLHHAYNEEGGEAITGSNVTLVRTFYQEHRGIAATRNACLEKASGEWLAFLDSDDIYAPGKLSAQAEYFRNHPECEIVFTRYKNFLTNEELKSIDRVQYELKIGSWNTYYLPTALIKREVFKRSGCFLDKQKLDKLEIWEDTEMLFRMQIFGARLDDCLEEVYYHRRIHGKNAILQNETTGIVYKEDDHNLYEPLFENMRQIVSKRYAESNSLISVIIPAKNASKYIAEAITSVVRAANMMLDPLMASPCGSLDDGNVACVAPIIEIIIVDDGSTDDTATIAEAMGCKVIKIEASGAPVARNIGLRHANGDFIIFHDADDIMEKYALAFMYNEFYNHPSLQVVFAMRRDFASPDMAPEKREEVSKGALSFAYYPMLLHGFFGAIAGCALIRRKVFDVVGDFDETLKVGDAIQWQIRLMDYGIETWRLPIVVCFRRIHGDNLSLKHKTVGYKNYAEILRRRLLSNVGKTKAS